VTPAGQIAAAIELLAAIDATPARPADGIANDYFRARRFIGSSDRRAISDRVWRIFRTHRRLVWWLADKQTPRLLVAASLLLDGGGMVDVETTFTGGRFGPAPLAPSEQLALRRLQGRALNHASMPDAVRLEMPDWLLPLLSPRLDTAELMALLEPAPLDLRINLLKATREEAAAALAA
jgi:16S rRNA (cytosine967-C5)-methyltransferase